MPICCQQILSLCEALLKLQELAAHAQALRWVLLITCSQVPFGLTS